MESCVCLFDRNLGKDSATYLVNCFNYHFFILLEQNKSSSV